MATQQEALPAVELSAHEPGEAGPENQVHDDLRCQIAGLAYQLWEARGCPEGSPEQDWLEAEQTLVSHESS